MRHIIHADLDAFYAAVEQLDNPQLRGKPVLVGGSPEGRGVVATASYEAREFGVHSAMPMATAVRHCPQGIIIRPHFRRYQEVSRQVMEIFRGLTPVMEPLSLDEAYLDITEAVEADQFPLNIALDLKGRVKADTGLDLSVGVATNKTVAKIASDLEKPDGLVVVPPGQEREFLAPLRVGKIPGVGPKTVERLRKEGILTIGQLADRPIEWFHRRFGKRAASLQARAQGQDQEPVHTERVTKSVSAETTFPTDVSDPDQLCRELAQLSAKVVQHLQAKELRGRTVTVKLRLADFTTFTRQTTLPALTSSESTVQESAQRLLSKELAPGRAFRLLGVGVSKFGEELREKLREEHQLELPMFGEQ